VQLLIEAFNPASVAGLMCRNTLSISWRGEVYDCDFNQQLGLHPRHPKPLFLWEVDHTKLEKMPITVASTASAAPLALVLPVAAPWRDLGRLVRLSLEIAAWQAFTKSAVASLIVAAMSSSPGMSATTRRNP
jgi:hypothetical protein